MQTPNVSTKMHKEAQSAPDMAREHLKATESLLATIVAEIKNFDPDFVVTCARGSSDHAATYAKYMFETTLGLPVVSHAPSVSSVFERPLRLKRALFIGISQSGASPDLVRSAEAARDQGALCLAIVNAPNSPLEDVCDLTLPLGAGTEESVAATKSYILSLVAIANLVAHLADDHDLKRDIQDLPDRLADAWQMDWTAAVRILKNARNFFVIGRGYGLGIVQEAALKFKETAGLHAEAYSAAEVKHGPMTLIGQKTPVLMFSPFGAASENFKSLANDLLNREAEIISVGLAFEGATNLDSIQDFNPKLAGICMIQSFYKFVNHLSIIRGFDPDQPPYLKKVTRTL